MYTPSVWLWGLYAVHSRRTRESCDVPDLNEQRVDWSLIGGGPPTPHCCHHQKKTNDLLKSKLIFKLTHRIFLREILSAFIFKHYRHFFPLLMQMKYDTQVYCVTTVLLQITTYHHLPPKTFIFTGNLCQNKHPQPLLQNTKVWVFRCPAFSHKIRAVTDTRAH